LAFKAWGFSNIEQARRFVAKNKKKNNN
jgi:hypothetical protein